MTYITGISTTVIPQCQEENVEYSFKISCSQLLMQFDSRYLTTGLFCLCVKSTCFNFIILRHTNVRGCWVQCHDSPQKRIAQQWSCTAVEKQMCVFMVYMLLHACAWWLHGHCQRPTCSVKYEQERCLAQYFLRAKRLSGKEKIS